MSNLWLWLSTIYIHLPWLFLTGEPNITDITHVHQIVQNCLAGFVRVVQDTPFNPVPLVAILKGIPDEDEPWIIGYKYIKYVKSSQNTHAKWNAYIHGELSFHNRQNTHYWTTICHVIAKWTPDQKTNRGPSLNVINPFSRSAPATKSVHVIM